MDYRRFNSKCVDFIYKRFTEEKIILFEFKKRIANYYCQSGFSNPKSIGSLKHYQNKTTIPNEMYFDQVIHWSMKFGIKENTKLQIRNRCKFPQCNKLSSYYCDKCCVAICIECFKKFHSLVGTFYSVYLVISFFISLDHYVDAKLSANGGDRKTILSAAKYKLNKRFHNWNNYSKRWLYII